ncbi:hypothetical protein [Aliikangiella maris]|uniref:DUF4178 domain-containing protein n=2 Tax=Aliikangiella maris TaxID=3162458 RepID=A0ABV2BRA0_9GAMM
MFSKWFGKDKSETRALSDPAQLQIDDMLEMVDSFGLPEQVRGKTFQVSAINTYEYQRERETEFVLKGDDSFAVHMTIEDDDGEKYINFTLPIERDEVEHLFDIDTFSQVFDEDVCRETIEVIGDTAGYERWIAPSYFQQGGWYKGYFYRRDFRKNAMPSYEEKDAEPFEGVTLSSKDDKFFVSIEVWEDGTTEVFLGISRPIADIQSLFGKV